MELTSPVKRFPGTVIVPDYLTPEQVFAIEDCQFNARDYFKENTTETERLITNAKGEEVKAIESNSRFSWLRFRSHYIPAIVLCVKEWHLENFSLNGHGGASYETFPMTPAEDVSDLLEWVFSELVKIYNGASNVPNA